MNYYESSKLDLSLFLQLEYWLESTMISFEPITARQLVPFINGGVFAANECLYQFMRSLDIEYLSLGGGKSNFKKLPTLLKKAVYSSDEYMAYMDVLIKDGECLKCNPSDLELDDKDISYEGIEW